MMSQKIVIGKRQKRQSHSMSSTNACDRQTDTKEDERTDRMPATAVHGRAVNTVTN